MKNTNVYIVLAVIIAVIALCVYTRREKFDNTTSTLYNKTQHTVYGAVTNAGKYGQNQLITIARGGHYHLPTESSCPYFFIANRTQPKGSTSANSPVSFTVPVQVVKGQSWNVQESATQPGYYSLIGV